VARSELCNPDISSLFLLISVTDCPIDDCEQLEENISEANTNPANNIAPTKKRISTASTIATPLIAAYERAPPLIRLHRSF
jgi:hypothetical protein